MDLLSAGPVALAERPLALAPAPVHGSGHPSVPRALLSGLLAGLGLAVPVGPIGAHLVALAARSPVRVAVAAALGIAAADALSVLVAVLGGSALVSLVEPAAPLLRVLGALALLSLAAQLATAAVREHRCGGPAPLPGRSRCGRTGPRAVLTAVPPLTALYFLGFVVGIGAAAGGRLPQQVMFVAFVLGASACWQLFLAAGGVLLGPVLTGPRGRLCTGMASVGLTLLLAGRVLAGGLC